MASFGFYSSQEEEEEKRLEMLHRRIDSDISMFTGFILLFLVQTVFCHPKGGRGGGFRGGSFPRFSGIGVVYSQSPRSPPALSHISKVLILSAICGLLGISLIVWLYRTYMYCNEVPGQR